MSAQLTAQNKTTDALNDFIKVSKLRKLSLQKKRDPSTTAFEEMDFHQIFN